MMRAIVIRNFRPGDGSALHAVFHSAVHERAARDYTPEQVMAWAPSEWDRRGWSRRMRALAPFVAEVDGQPVGYADLQATGHIDHFYVAAAWSGRGVGRRLMERILDSASQRDLTLLWSDVSRTAQPFFAKFGFRLVRENRVLVRGVVLENARMERRKDEWV